MSDHSIFEKYLEHRYQKSGALTPGQKLEVLDLLEQEAREQGRVPVGERSVATVPVDNPAVQAVLRGEEVSLGAATVKSRAQGMLEGLPTAAKIGILVGIVLLPLMLMQLFSGGGKTEEEMPPTPEATLTLEPTPLPQPTDVPPTPLPPPTATHAMTLGLGGPAESNRDPASIEIAGQLFIVARGEVNEEDGSWKPQGPEWLSGTEVRRVFAVPYEALMDADVASGDEIYVRTRGGHVLTYIVRDVVRLQANQIETFFSLRPSLVVALPLNSGDVNSVERVLIFGEAQIEDIQVQAAPMDSPASGQANAFTYGGTNLRNNPGLDSDVLIGMPANTPLYVNLSTPPVRVDDVDWVYVLSPYGYGWVAKQMVSIP